MSESVRFVTIDENSAGQRLDNFLIKILKGVPKSLIYRVVRKGQVRVNKGRAKPDTRLKVGDIVRVPPVRVSQKTQEHKPSRGLLKLLDESIIFENDELMIVNKPPGLAVHAGSGIRLGLIEALRARTETSAFLELVHRLDRATSGCVMIAKTRVMLAHLQGLLRQEGQIKKRYLALVEGQWPAMLERVDAPLRKKEVVNGERFVTVDSTEGKASLTVFRLLEHFDECSLVEAEPRTGRTHQIRVHAQHVGHPLVGDDKYGRDQVNRKFRDLGANRLFLHAFSLSIPMLDGRVIDVSAALPEELQGLLEVVRKPIEG